MAKLKKWGSLLRSRVSQIISAPPYQFPPSNNIWKTGRYRVPWGWDPLCVLSYYKILTCVLRSRWMFQVMQNSMPTQMGTALIIQQTIFKFSLNVFHSAIRFFYLYTTLQSFSSLFYSYTFAPFMFPDLLSVSYIYIQITSVS